MTNTKKKIAKKSAATRLLSALENVAAAVESGDPKNHPGVRVTVRDIRDVEIEEPPAFDAVAVRALRERVGLSQAAFAKFVGSSTVTVSKWEQGKLAPNTMARRLLGMVQAAPKKATAGVVKSAS